MPKFGHIKMRTVIARIFQTINKPRDASKGPRALRFLFRRGRSARKTVQCTVFSGGRAAAQGVYVAEEQMKFASYINFWP